MLSPAPLRRILALTCIVTLVAACLVSAPARRVEAQSAPASAPSGVRISQVYTRGGESGAAFNRDYIEIFNGGTSNVDINNWSLHVRTVSGGATLTFQIFIFAPGLALEPGRYFLFKLSGGQNGAPVPSPNFDVDILNFNLFHLDKDRGQVALLSANATPPPAFGCPPLPSDGIEDFVGYGSATCSEGGDAAPAPEPTTALVRAGHGCTDTGNNDDDFALAAAAPHTNSTPAAPCLASGQSIIQFGVPQFSASEMDARAQIFVSRIGDTSSEATVEYETTDGTASERSDYNTALGTLRFAPGETLKTFDVLLNDDIYEEGNETVNLSLSNPTGGATLGTRSSATLVVRNGLIFTPPSTTNPMDIPPAFVRQHYRDFLNRNADTGGLAFWTNGITRCGSDAACVQVKRVDTSAAFFLSIEFQQTGYFVYRTFKAALPARDTRPRALPRYREFLRDTQEIGRGVVVGTSGWEARLAANRRAFLDSFVARPEFVDNYPASLSAAEYVDKLNAQAGGVLSTAERDALVEGLLSGAETRASVLGKVADDPDFVRAEFNRAFVLMQYYGYLRRNPTDAPDTSFAGYDFWLQKLDEAGGDYRRAEMVRAFIESIEYRQRFAP